MLDLFQRMNDATIQNLVEKYAHFISIYFNIFFIRVQHFQTDLMWVHEEILYIQIF